MAESDATSGPATVWAKADEAAHNTMEQIRKTVLDIVFSWSGAEPSTGGADETIPGEGCPTSAMRRASAGGSGAPAIAIRDEGETLALEGALDVRTLTAARDDLARRLAQRKPRAIDLGQLSSLDTPGALFLCRLSGDD